MSSWRSTAQQPRRRRSRFWRDHKGGRRRGKGDRDGGGCDDSWSHSQAPHRGLHGRYRSDHQRQHNRGWQGRLRWSGGGGGLAKAAVLVASESFKPKQKDIVVATKPLPPLAVVGKPAAAAPVVQAASSPGNAASLSVCSQRAATLRDRAAVRGGIDGRRGPRAAAICQHSGCAPRGERRAAAGGVGQGWRGEGGGRVDGAARVGRSVTGGAW